MAKYEPTSRLTERGRILYFSWFGIFLVVSLLAAWKRVEVLHKHKLPIDTFDFGALIFAILTVIIWFGLVLWKWRLFVADWKEGW
jgi:hypothetical protein